MAIIGILFIVAGLLAFGWVCCTMATYALPIMTGFCISHWLMKLGAGPALSIAAGVVAGFAVLVAGHLAASARRPGSIAPVAMALFMIPAGIASVAFTLGLLTGLAMPSQFRLPLCILATAIVVARIPAKLKMPAAGR